MKKPYKILLVVISVIIVIYLSFCTWFYFNQEEFVFFPEKLEANYKYTFNGDFKEIEIKASDEIMLNSLLFKTKNPSGLIFYLHGAGGNLKAWGKYAKELNNLNYDVYMLDYRGYGKSDGAILNEAQFYNDVQLAYDYIKRKYPESEIIILGTSGGSAAASWLGFQNQPKELILLSPYYSMPDLKNNFPALKFLRFIPNFLVKYKFRNYENIEKLTVPLTIMHGDQDDFIYYGSSLKLKNHFKPGDTLITIKGGPHHIHHENEQVYEELKRILKYSPPEQTRHNND